MYNDQRIIYIFVSPIFLQLLKHILFYALDITIKERIFMQREKLSSRLGFILLSAGCAIGIGNVWKFPYIAGQNGGAIFILIYLFFLLVLGIPVMTMEFAIGRAAQRSIATMYQKLEPKGSKWHLHRWLGIAGNTLLMMFYTTVAGWMLKYFVDTLSGKFVGLSPEAIGEQFNVMLSNPVSNVFYMVIIVLIGFGICAIGLQNGLEKITKVMMIALLLLMVVLAGNSIFLDGAKEGLAYYLLPDWDRFLAIGPLNVIVSAMNQAFFTLSLGIGSMAIFGSYIDKNRSLLGESINIAILDTFVAFTAGLIIIPACFAFNVDVNSGPNLIFITLPNVFNQMALGQLWGALFFLFMTFAAFSTVLAVFETIIAFFMDSYGWSRKKVCLFACIAILILALPCALGFNVLSFIQPLGQGTTILDFEDFLVSNLLLPFGSLLFVLFCTTKIGWGWDNFIKEANTGIGIKFPTWVHAYCKYAIPVIIATILIIGLI